MLDASLATISIQDPVHRITLTMSRIASAMFLFSDNIVWLSRVGIIDVDRTKWARTANKFWLYSIVMNLLRDLYEIKCILEKSHRRSKFRISRTPVYHTSPYPSEFEIVRQWILANRAVSFDTLKNACDLCIPLSSLGHINLSPTSVGFLGMISSAVAILQIIDYSARLSPS